MPDQLGDLSELSASERAELVSVTFRQRIYDDLVRGEAVALRNFITAAGICAAGVVFVIGPEFLRGNYGGFRSLLSGLPVLDKIASVFQVVGIIGSFLSFYPSIYLAIKWVLAMRRRRRAAG